jgi:hypothetical protein
LYSCKTDYFQKKGRQTEIALTAIGFGILERPSVTKVNVTLFASIIQIHQIDSIGPKTMACHRHRMHRDYRHYHAPHTTLRTNSRRLRPESEKVFQNLPPDQIPSQMPLAQPPPNLPPLRYLAASARYQDRFCVRTRGAFIRCEMPDRTIISFDAQMAERAHTSVTSFALERAPALRVLVFHGFAPTLAGQVIRKI